MELVSTHCHTGYCGHGDGEVSEYVQAARGAGLTTLAFTDHYPLSPQFDPSGYISVPMRSMPAYEQAVRDAADRNPDMEIMLGIELDYLSDTEDRDLNGDNLERFDLILGSVHYVDKWPFDDPELRYVWDEPGAPDRIWSRYVDIWCEMALDSNLRFDVLSHPDLPKKFDRYPSFDLSESYKRMAEAAKAGGRMIELNTSGTYYACNEIFPAPDLLREFAKAGVPCTIGTDAHKPEHVARDIEKGYAVMVSAGYRNLTVPTKSGDRRIIPFD